MTTVPCPTCKTPVPLGAEVFPFCSERCRLIDLGRWANEEYRIPGPAGPEPAPEEEDADEV